MVRWPRPWERRMWKGVGGSHARGTLEVALSQLPGKRTAELALPIFLAVRAPYGDGPPGGPLNCPTYQQCSGAESAPLLVSHVVWGHCLLP